MFLRTVKAAGGQGVQHEYVRLVEAYREDGRAKQRVVCNLGRKDLLAAHLDALIRLLRGEPVRRAAVRLGEVQATGAWDWGPMLVARALWRELGLDAILDGQGGRGAGGGRALAGRALGPGGRGGPAGRGDAERRAGRLPRVRVELRQLKQWYRTLDQLAARKPLIEQELYLRLRDLFSLKVDLALYDLTSTYFEGQGPPTLGAHGHSRDGKPRNRQVLVGVVLVDGWPITHHVFHGSARDATTVPQVLEDLEQRFGLRRGGFGGARGMVTSANLALLRTRRQGYVVGLNRRRREDVYRYIERATGPWTDCPAGRTAREQPAPPKTRVQEGAADHPGVRVFVVQSDERLAYEQTQRLKAMGRGRQGLQALERRRARGRLKQPAQIGAAAARILGRSHGYRYYDWTYRDGRFRFFEHPANLKGGEAYEGTYVIQTEGPPLTPG